MCLEPCQCPARVLRSFVPPLSSPPRAVRGAVGRAPDLHALQGGDLGLATHLEVGVVRDLGPRPTIQSGCKKTPDWPAHSSVMTL